MDFNDANFWIKYIIRGAPVGDCFAIMDSIILSETRDEIVYYLCTHQIELLQIMLKNYFYVTQLNYMLVCVFDKMFEDDSMLSEFKQLVWNFTLSKPWNLELNEERNIAFILYVLKTKDYDLDMEKSVELLTLYRQEYTILCMIFHCDFLKFSGLNQLFTYIYRTKI